MPSGNSLCISPSLGISEGFCGYLRVSGAFCADRLALPRFRVLDLLSMCQEVKRRSMKMCPPEASGSPQPGWQLAEPRAFPPSIELGMASCGCSRIPRPQIPQTSGPLNPPTCPRSLDTPGCQDFQTPKSQDLPDSRTPRFTRPQGPDPSDPPPEPTIPGLRPASSPPPSPAAQVFGASSFPRFLLF